MTREDAINEMRDALAAVEAMRDQMRTVLPADQTMNTRPTITITFTAAERGLLMHALLDQILRRGSGGIGVYHDVVTREDATPEGLLARILEFVPTRATPPDNTTKGID